MTASLFDSPAWRGLFHDAELTPLFTDTATLRANLLVMGTLALAQAKAGTVPEVSAQAIHRAAMEVQIDPAALAKVTADTGDMVAALVVQFQSEMQAPEHAKWVHNASDTALTSATGLSLRLRQSFKIIEARLGADAGQLPRACAFHTDPTLRAGLANGLGLADAGDSDPVAHIQTTAAWITKTAAAQTPTTARGHAIQHQLPHLNVAIQSAPPHAAPLVNVMTLPQMVLGLGKLVT